MKIVDGIETGIDYYWKRSEGWVGLDGKTERWWDYFVEVSGYNGAGGLWIVEKSRHSGETSWFSRQPRTLSLAESRQLIADLLKHQEGSDG